MPTIVALGAVHWLCQKDSVAATWDLNVFAGGLFSVNGSLLGWYKHVHPTYIPNSKSFRNRVIYIYICISCTNVLRVSIALFYTWPPYRHVASWGPPGAVSGLSRKHISASAAAFLPASVRFGAGS